MSNDISYLLTKEKQKNGCIWAHYEKAKDVRPAEYGGFLSRKKKRKRR